MKELLAKKASRANSYEVVGLVANSKAKYSELVEIIKENNSPYSEKAAWVITHCFDERAGFFDHFYSDFIKIIGEESYSDSVKRNIVRILQFKSIPTEYHGAVIDACFRLLTKKETAIAVKAFSMGVLDQMVKIYPELTNELILCIEEILPVSSSGVKNRGNKILKKLKGSSQC